MLLTNANDLAEKIKHLQADRQRHVDAMAEIDRVLHRIEQVLGAVSNAHTADLVDNATPARRRGRFNQTGIQSVLDFIAREGRPSTADINRHWRSEGRKGTANVTLLKLLKDGAIHRQVDPDVRGSRYIAGIHNKSVANEATVAGRS
ncbi:MAG TPA: hypothetical protein VH475_21680 [Tepidisphaeraceae bacterium]|jgi:hypothetical protein